MIKWNPQKRCYEQDGKPLSPQRVRDYLEDYITANRDEIGSKADSLIKAGASAALITLFFNFLRDRVTEMHGTAGVIAYGGEDQMSGERWARVGQKIATELGYVEKFSRAVNESRRAMDQIINNVSLVAPNVPLEQIERVILTTPPGQLSTALERVVESPVVDQPAFDRMIWGEVGSRSRMYADATYSTYANQEKMRESDAGVLRGRRVTEGDANVCDGCEAAASSEYVPLGELLDIGDAECLSRCRCHIEFDYHGIEPITMEREIYAPGFANVV